MTLRARLLLALVPLFVLCLVAADAATYAEQQSFLYGQLQQQAQSGANLVARSVPDGGGPGGPNGGAPGGPGSPPGVVWGEVLSTTGGVVGSPQFLGVPTQDQLSPTANHPVLPGQLASEPGRYLTVSGVGSYSQYLVYIEPDGGGNGDIVVTAVPMDSYDATLGHLLLLELLVGAVVVVLLVLATWLIIRRGLRPLARMGDTARAIAGGDLGRRVTPADPTTEVGRLGLALNSMLDQLQAAFGQRAAVEQRLRQFLSDASHELRTPLTSMRGYAELVRRNRGMNAEDLELALRRIEDEARRMGVLVDDLMLLARLDQGRPLERAPVDLEALIADACADARVGDPARAITTRLDAPLVVAGDDPPPRPPPGRPPPPPPAASGHGQPAPQRPGPHPRRDPDRGGAPRGTGVGGDRGRRPWAGDPRRGEGTDLRALPPCRPRAEPGPGGQRARAQHRRRGGGRPRRAGGSHRHPRRGRHVPGRAAAHRCGGAGASHAQSVPLRGTLRPPLPSYSMPRRRRVPRLTTRSKPSSARTNPSTGIPAP
jgi:two-component system OmpR family sensor kinase